MEKLNNYPAGTNQPLQQKTITKLLRAYFQLLYHQFAWSYDLVASLVSLGIWQTWIMSVLPSLDGPRVLEIGFGTGHLQVALHKKGISTFGLDESHQMGRITHRRLSGIGLQSGLTRGQARMLPFINACFDQIVLTFPSEFILDPLTLLEIHRVLVRGGTAVLLPLAWITGHSPIERAIAWLNRATGETQEWHEESLEPYKELGFDVNWKMINFRTSKVLLIFLSKP